MRPPAEFLVTPAALVAKSTKRTSFGFPYRAAAVPKGVTPLAEKGRTGGDYETEVDADAFPLVLARVLIVEGPMRGLVRAVRRPGANGLRSDV